MPAAIVHLQTRQPASPADRYSPVALCPCSCCTQSRPLCGATWTACRRGRSATCCTALACSTSTQVRACLVGCACLMHAPALQREWCNAQADERRDPGLAGQAAKRPRFTRCEMVHHAIRIPPCICMRRTIVCVCLTTSFSACLPACRHRLFRCRRRSAAAAAARLGHQRR